MPDNVHEMWSENELDDAMAALYPEVQVNTDAETKARAALMLAARAGEPPVVEATEQTVVLRRRRRRGPLAAVAAAIAVIAVGAVVVITQASSPTEVQPAQQNTNQNMPRPPATTGSEHAPMPPAPDQPQNSLPSLAARVAETPLAPGQYRYVSNRNWQVTRTENASRKQYIYLFEQNTETWIPANQQLEWLLRENLTGNRRWLKGTEQEAIADGVKIRDRPVFPSGEARARCGEFSYGNSKPCTHQPVGSVDTPDGPAQPPSDPRKLYEFLAGASAKHPDPPLEFFRTAQVLLGARFPATTRRAALEALSYHQYLAVKDATTSDDRPAVSVSIEYADGKLREEVLLAPANGQLIGRRTVAIADVDGVKAGDTLHDGVLHQAVVNGIGVQPTR